MSSAHHDDAKAPAGDALNRTPTPNSQQLEKHTAAEGTLDSQVVQYPAPLAFFLLMLAICISIFLVALDRTIITTVSDNLLLSLVLLIRPVIRQYPISLISSTPTTMSAGTRVHISSPPALFYRLMDAYMACSIRSGSS